MTLRHQSVQGGSYTESLLTPAAYATGKTNSGQCNQGFMRDGALLHIIAVSDEPEQSGQTAAHWVSQFENYVSDPALLRVSAVVDLSQGRDPGPLPAYRVGTAFIRISLDQILDISALEAITTLGEVLPESAVAAR